MAFVPGTKSRYYVGPMRFSMYGKSLSAEVTCNQLDTSTMETTAVTYANGQKNASASIEMMLDTSTVAPSQFTLLNTWQTTPQPITVGLAGVAAGDVVWMMNGNQSSVSFGSTVGDLVTTNVSVQPDGPVDWGNVIEAEAAVTATANGASNDLTAQSTNGAVAHLHVTDFTGLTSNDITIEDSSTGSSGWATIGTFTTVTGTTSQRLTIAGTVKRYVRVVDTVVGTGSCTRFVTFARR